jgi:peptide-methionine (S)-S-oxide reductase
MSRTNARLTVGISLTLGLTLALGVGAWLAGSPLYAADGAAAVAPPVLDLPKAAGPPQSAVFSGGCFWGVQAVFEHTRGVRQVLAGYAGGEKSTAEYETVSTGTTGHAESVQVSFDPAQISYGELLRVFFSVAHNPTELNRQGPDSGTQYRSEIFYLDEHQKQVAEAYIAQLDHAKAFSRKIVTRVDPYKGFYPAEGYHQDFLIHHPDNPYIVYNDLPKIENFRRLLPEDFRATPAALVAPVAVGTSQTPLP